MKKIGFFSIILIMDNISSFNQLMPQHFSPVTRWQEVKKEGRVYLQDTDTKVKYQKLDTSFRSRVGRGLYALLWAPIALAGSALLATVMRITRVVTFKPFWEALPVDPVERTPATLKDRVKVFGKDALMIPGGLLAVIPAELSVVYSVFSPQNGMKNADTWSRVITADMLPPVIDIRDQKRKDPFKID